MALPNRAGLLALLVVLAACSSQERWYEPSCIAYEGDRVILRGTQFEWHKFSDQVPMGVDGERANPSPRYPMSGTYHQEDDRIEFKPDDGSEISDYFMLDHLGARYLLSEEQQQRFDADGLLQNCALKLVTAE
ncbi:MAG: hypothetical protein ACR2QR_06255 [Woeseiaceae bacterium]